MANWMENTTQMRFSYRLLPIKWLTWVHSYFFTIKIFWSKYLAWKFMLNLPIYLCSLGALLFVLNSCMGFSDLSSVQRGRDWLSVYFVIRWYVWTNLCSVSLCIFTISFICIQCKIFPTNEKREKRSTLGNVKIFWHDTFIVHFKKSSPFWSKIWMEVCHHHGFCI